MAASANDPRRAVLYARVSTEEQAKKGYSLAGQLGTLKELATREGYEVVGEATDPGHTGATLERPGIDRVRDLAEAGEIEVVLAREIDRVSREPWHYEYLKAWLEDRGVELRALDDDGDGSPLGEFVAYVRRGVAKLERADIARRTANGRLQKAREGKVVAPGRPRYGFGPRASGEGWEVDEEKMEVVRRIFRSVAGGASLMSIKRAFEREGIPTPQGARFWDRSFFRSCVLDDVYRPHTMEEVRALASAKAIARLDPKACYGISWQNKRGLTRARTAEPFGNGGADRRRYRWHDKPKEDWVPVPVPDSGIPRELVDAARAAIKDNRAPSRAGGRFWELSGGVAVCAECGRRMLTRHKPKVKNGKRYEYDYYQCSGHHSHGRAACENSRSAAAGKLEARVWERVRDFLRRPERLEAGLSRLVEEEREGLLADPGPEIERLEKKMAAADRKRAKFQRMAAEDEPLITFSELRERLAEQDEVKRAARERIHALNRGRERLERLEQDRDALLDHYRTVVPPKLDALSPEQRRRIHAVLGTQALIGRDGGVEVRLNKVRLTVDGRDEAGANPRSGKTEDSSRSARTAGR